MTPEQEKRLAEIESGIAVYLRGSQPARLQAADLQWLCNLAHEQAARIAELEESLGRLSTWDIGSMNDYGGGNVAWWHDYIRSVVGRMSEVACEALEASR